MPTLLALPQATDPAEQTTGLTLAELLAKFGSIPAWRIVTDPAPGTATFEDFEAFEQQHGHYCELIDGVLLEKEMSFQASRIAAKIITRLNVFIEPRNLGIVAGEQGFLRLTTGRVRGPDVSFIAWDRLPGGREPEAKVPNLAPTLAVEVISPGNTREEMDDKRDDYFRSGVALVWYVYPLRREVHVFTSPDAVAVLSATATLDSATAMLDGGTVLPGFTLPLADLFAEPSSEV